MKYLSAQHASAISLAEEPALAQTLHVGFALLALCVPGLLAVQQPFCLTLLELLPWLPLHDHAYIATCS